jgi:hypothetical protein
MDVMKRLLFLVCVAAVVACGADLSGVQSVYLMPMSHGMDQYLANHLTGGHVLQVVTDPKLADGIFTDRVGEAFEARLEQVSPPPESAKPAPPPSGTDQSGGAAPEMHIGRPPLPGSNSSFGGGKGMVFLVDAKSRQVVWSAFDLPKSFASKDLDRTASDIVSRLKKDLNPGKK